MNIETQNWASTNPTQNQNIFYHYPKDEALFKKKVAENGGLIVQIYKNDQLIDTRQANSDSQQWSSTVFSYLKTMSINGSKYDQCFQNCKFYAVPKGYESIFQQEKTQDIRTQIKEAYANYAQTLYNLNDYKANSDENNQSLINQKIIKTLKTQEEYPFYVVKNESSIVPITTGKGDTLSPLTNNILERILDGEPYEHSSYHDPIFQDILETNNLSYSYWLIPTNRDSEYDFDAIKRFEKENKITFSKPTQRMQVGEVAFIYVAHLKSIYLKTRIVEICRDSKDTSYYVLKLEKFLDTPITLEELNKAELKSASLAKTQEFKREFLRKIYAQRKRNTQKQQFWLYKPGENAEKWDFLYQNNLMSIWLEFSWRPKSIQKYRRN